MATSNAQQHYEGCGKLGPIRSIFFAEFHPITGPMIRCQAPHDGKDLITEEVFEAFSVYVIPKPQLDRTPLTVNSLDRKICGYPVILKDEKYKRNQFMFNVCFVCYPWSRTVQYEPALKKLSHFLVDLEQENGFLYNEQNNDQLQALLEQVFVDLNNQGECSAVVNGYSLQLKVISNNPDPPDVHEWDVPVLLVSVKLNNANEGNVDFDSDHHEWDLTTRQILPHINGIHHVAKIANIANVVSNLVIAAIQNLIYHKVVALVPIFMYRNVYCLTPKVKELREDKQLRDEFLHFIKRDRDNNEIRVSFRDVFKMISEFNNHTSVLDICVKFRPHETMNIDENRLVQYLVLKKILRRVHKYPVYVPEESNQAGLMGVANANAAAGAPVPGGGGSASEFYHFFTGQIHFDEICCRTGISAALLEEKIDSDPNVHILRQ